MHIPAEYLVAVAAFVVALLTFFTGFGLGTLLMPAFAWLLHDVPTAVAATAVVHLANNLLKLGLVGRRADRGVVLKFGMTAVLFSFLGAWVLTSVARGPELARYTLGGQTYAVTVEKLIIASLMFLFAAFELLPTFNRLAFAPRWLPVGGALSGFFGGLSGHQGPLRSAFLMRCGLEKTAFIGTGAVCAVLVDTARLVVYGASVWVAPAHASAGSGRLVMVGMAGAFAGTLLGNRMLHKVTWTAVRVTVGVVLMLMAVALGAGWI
jgi:uncharacterized membrane protein YfcA